MNDGHSTISFAFQARGHRLIKASHKTTLELTKDHNLTEKGDCIVGVSSSHGLNDLPIGIKKKIQLSSSLVVLKLKIGEGKVKITGQGDPNLTLTHLTDIVIRKSSFTCPRTLFINSSHGATDLPEAFVNLLKEDTTINAIIEVQENYFENEKD